jgi:hypothetical protein
MIIIPAALGSSQILASDATRDAILPYIKVFASLARWGGDMEQSAP